MKMTTAEAVETSVTSSLSQDYANVDDLPSSTCMIHYVAPCCVVLCCCCVVVLCCVVSCCCVMPCFTVLGGAVSCFVALYCGTLRHAVPCCTVL